ncbi:MAG: hypothetical protein ALECFALPRED_003911 [Alectoria fallacina]|uniref:Uncharacterized protein n=1 Tax=Alectoria fallacina TaxID=1903189 RepID=A0A8H3FRU8_9LECA|nr:MAG: hypothetical protein ALECFALPRED_003911 [Alectoria fallacina]
MLFSQPPTLLSLLFTILSSTHTSDARRNARDRELLESQYHYLSERSCAGTACGWSGQLCCTSDQACSTNSLGQAECVASSSADTSEEGQWEYYTTTFVESELVTMTSTYSSFFAAESTTATAASPTISAISCDTSMNESPCGTICCAVGQYCAFAGQCAASNGNSDLSSSYLNSVVSTTATAAATNTAFIRPTTNVATTITTTGSMTTTVPFMTASASASSASSAAGMTATTANNGLSAGAIAGIVIGVLLGLFLLFLFCAFYCFKGLLDGILSFFGLRNRKRRTEVIEEERYSHHGRASGGGGRTWYGGTARPARVDRPKQDGLGGFLGVAGILGALAIFLGLKRRRDRRAKTETTASTYSYSDFTSESEFHLIPWLPSPDTDFFLASPSSDGRTRDTRRTTTRR